jgi:DNA processing protein
MLLAPLPAWVPELAQTHRESGPRVTTPEALRLGRISSTRALTFDRPRIAIVGARSAADGPLTFTREAAGACARAGFVVISGGALGVDRAAHEGALAVGGETWAVIPNGRGHEFPPENADLFAQIERCGGALLYPQPGAKVATRPQFFQRNAVLAALADVVLVVQAGARSGARNTALWARRYRRDVLCVRGAPWDGSMEGNAAELALGALPVVDLPSLLTLALERAPRARAPQQPATVASDPAAAELYRSLPVCPEQPIYIDDIIAQTKLPPGWVQAQLGRWTLSGSVENRPSGWYRRNHP